MKDDERTQSHTPTQTGGPMTDLAIDHDRMVATKDEPMTEDDIWRRLEYGDDA